MYKKPIYCVGLAHNFGRTGEFLGASMRYAGFVQVRWDGENRSVQLQRKDIIMTSTLERPTAYVDRAKCIPSTQRKHNYPKSRKPASSFSLFSKSKLRCQSKCSASGTPCQKRKGHKGTHSGWIYKWGKKHSRA